MPSALLPAQPPVDEEASISESQRAYRGQLRRRRAVVALSRLAVIVVILGGWQLYVGGDARKTILYGEPSGILAQLRTWVTDGTSLGPWGTRSRSPSRRP